MHEWTAKDTPPPASQYPRLKDGTLVAAREARFPAIPGVADPTTITGPARVVGKRPVALPHLVPKVDSDGIEMAGIRGPELVVPLATTTGWNFRSKEVGNPGDIYQLMGSYLPFERTRADRTAKADPRPAIEERYKGRDEYLSRIQTAAANLVRGRYLLQEDLDEVLIRANRHWEFATKAK